MWITWPHRLWASVHRMCPEDSLPEGRVWATLVIHSWVRPRLRPSDALFQRWLSDSQLEKGD